MVDLISTAYGVTPDKVREGPNWLELDRFDIVAKLPIGADAEARRQMLQSLLKDRFGLVLHNEARPLPAYVLTAEKKTLLKSADDSEDQSRCKDETPPREAAAPTEVTLVNYSCEHMTMAKFVAQMNDMRAAGEYIGDNPVVDQTGLTGAWDFRLQFHQRVMTMAAGMEIVTMAAGLAKLGLKLDVGNVPTPVLVVDGVNRKPTDNSPDVAKALPPIPLAFDVAELKPSDPDARFTTFKL